MLYIIFKLLFFVQITTDDLMSIERHAKCDDKMILMKEGLYPPSIKFVVNYNKLRSLDISYEQKSNTVQLASASATYIPGISFEFSVYSLDSNIQIQKKSHPKSDEMPTVAEGTLWL